MIALGVNLCQCVRRAEAIQVLNQAGNADVWQALVQYNLAVILAEAGQVEEALIAAAKALEASASDKQVGFMVKDGPNTLLVCSELLRSWEL